MKEHLNWRWTTVAIFALLGARVAMSAGFGYLPAVGPAPLRFLVEPRIFTNQLRIVLPPLEPAAPTTEASPPVVVAPPLVNVAASTNAIETTAGFPAEPVELPPPDNVVSPQMFLKFFNKPTNSPNSIITPMEFTPPKIAEPPPSKATLSTGQ